LRPRKEKANPAGRNWQLKAAARISNVESSGFDNFSGFNAARADLYLLVAAGRKLDTDRLQIRIESPARLVVRV
jgi:hypothetical protein